MRKLKILVLLIIWTPDLFGQAAAAGKTGSSKSFVLGIIDELASEKLAETRTLNIYLPEGYNPEDTIRYPVIYLLDGSAGEDFIHVAGLVQFDSFPWVKRVPRSIVVGIATVDRRRDFTYPTTIREDKVHYPTTGHSSEFISFIADELQPFIEGKYHVNDSRTIIGQSLGGLLAAEILLKNPGLFSKYIIISPSLWWDNGSLLGQTTDILNNTRSHRTDIYIGVGKEGLTSTQTPHLMEADAGLLAKKIEETGNKKLQVYFDYMPAEDHATVAHQAIYNAFRLLYQKPVDH